MYTEGSASVLRVTKEAIDMVFDLVLHPFEWKTGQAQVPEQLMIQVTR